MEVSNALRFSPLEMCGYAEETWVHDETHGKSEALVSLIAARKLANHLSLIAQPPTHAEWYSLKSSGGGRVWAVWRPLLAFICSTCLVGCATDPKRFPEATPERISLSPAEVKAARTPANAFYLSPHERKLCVKRATEGDIVAARKLAQFYFTNHEGPERTKRDDEKFDYWQRVLARLEKAARR
jgi:hypothetical protein